MRVFAETPIRTTLLVHSSTALSCIYSMGSQLSDLFWVNRNVHDIPNLFYLVTARGVPIDCPNKSQSIPCGKMSYISMRVRVTINLTSLCSCGSLWPLIWILVRALEWGWEEVHSFRLMRVKLAKWEMYAIQWEKIWPQIWSCFQVRHGNIKSIPAVMESPLNAYCLLYL